MQEVPLLAFVIASFIGIATPGPDVLLAMMNGSRHGIRQASIGFLGVALSDLILIGSVALGIGALLIASEICYTTVKCIGVAYLGFIGLTMLRSQGSLDDALRSAADARPGCARAIFMRCFFVAVTNPKAWLFFVAILPQFIIEARPQLPQYACLTIIVIIVDVAVLLVYATVGSKAVRFLRNSGALWMERLCGSVLLILAGALALHQA